MRSPFTRKLLKWHKELNTRSMPWKGEKDPYKIWLSEVILQQTRVEQGLKYYDKFITAFPTVHLLAKAPEQTVFKMWEGLGYYSRCKNLIETARVVSQELDGKFPDTYKGIKGLKGIGAYTAAAIASFAYNLPYAVLDGNVVRVISRYFGISTPIDNEGRKLYQQLADALLDKKQPAAFNQAIMDFGAVICKPRQPLCAICTQRKDCEAYKHNLVDQLPVKEKALPKKTRWFYYFVIEYKDRIYIRKRRHKDIWANLYEFVLTETGSRLQMDHSTTLQEQLETVLGNVDIELGEISREYRQQLTHQTIIGQFITVKINKPSLLLEEYRTVSISDLSRFPFPKFIGAYILEKAII